MLEKPLILYTVPVRNTLRALFNCERFAKVFFDSTMTHHCIPGIYENVCCGSEYEKTNMRDEVVVMIQLYYDGFNLGDALKQNMNKFKIGAFYFRILNLPSELQSLQKNIHLCGLFNENDINENGLNCVLKHIVDMFEDLEENGLELEIKSEANVTRFRVAVCSGAFDNLACHEMLGNFKEY